MTEALERVSAEEAGPGEIIAVAGLEEVTIGETLADPEDPRPLPVIEVDEPSLSIVLGINTSPLAGQEGSKLTARQIRDRLDAELVGNVSIRVDDTERPDAWEVQGRGELQLVVLLELMRREGFELTAGQPRVVTREIDGEIHEPVERLAIDVPEEHVGAVTQMLAGRKGRLEQMVNHSTGWVRMDYLVPARGLIGFRTEFLTETRGTGILHHVFDRWEPWAGELRTRQTGSLVADRRGKTASYSLFSLQDRGTLFVGPGEEVYEGMIVGENARSDDLDVNPTKDKQQTNVRAASADVLVRLAPPTRLTPRNLAGVPARRRVRRSHPRVGPPAQGGTRQNPAAQGRQAWRCRSAPGLTAGGDPPGWEPGSQLAPPLLQEADDTREHGAGFAGEADVGDAGHLDPDELQILLAQAVALEGPVRAMSGVGVKFYDEAILRPIDVKLEARLDEVGRGARQARPQNRCEEAPLELRARERGRLVERDRPPQPSPAMMPPRPLEQILHRAEVELLQLFAALQHPLQLVGPEGSGEIEQGPGDRGERNSLGRSAVLLPQPARAVDANRQPLPAGNRAGDVKRGGAPARKSVQPGRGVMTEQRTRPARQNRGRAPAVQRQPRMADRIDAAVEPVQPSSRHPLLDRPLRIAEPVQLPN